MRGKILCKLLGFLLRQIIPVPVVGGASAKAAESIGAYIDRRGIDHGQKLLTAIDTAYANAWQALVIAVGGDGFARAAQRLFLGPDEVGRFSDEIRQYLEDGAIRALNTLPDKFRRDCVKELKTMRKNDYDSTAVSKQEIVGEALRFERYSDPSKMIDGACLVASQIADFLGEQGYENLARLFGLRDRRGVAGAKEGASLFVVAFTYFFRVEVEKDQQLANGLIFGGLRQLSESQAKSFANLGAALEKIGKRFDEVLDVLAEIKEVAVETQGVVVETQGVVIETHNELLETQGVVIATHNAVLDTNSAVGKTSEAVLGLSALLHGHDEQIRQVGQQVMKLLELHQLDRRALQPGDSLSIRGDDERRLVKEAIARYRALPEEKRQKTPALLNAVGKLQVVTGEYEAAQRDFQEVAKMVPGASEKAEAHYNAYRAALERSDWDTALRELVAAVKLDGRRFALFPGTKYNPIRILGAGGFGVAFLCRHKFMDAQVVVKALLEESMDQDADKVFTEANLLNAAKGGSISETEAIIGIQDCGFLDVKRKSRPYLVMEYFESMTLEKYVEKLGPLPLQDFLGFAQQIAKALQFAHRRGVLHRDIKPANLLVRKENNVIKAKIIDFGLALKQTSVVAKESTKRTNKTAAGSSQNSVMGASIEGTRDYSAPEQMGLRNEKVGTYSDVYAFGKTCCYSLFQTTSPLPKHWNSVPASLADLLGRSLEDDPIARPQDFGDVLDGLNRAGDSAVPSFVRNATKKTLDALRWGREAKAGQAVKTGDPEAIDVVPAAAIVSPASADSPASGNSKGKGSARKRKDEFEDDHPRRTDARCPFCRASCVPVKRQKVSSAGWAVFVVLLLVCWPLFWIGLLMKEEYRICGDCGSKLP